MMGVTVESWEQYEWVHPPPEYVVKSTGKFWKACFSESYPYLVLMGLEFVRWLYRSHMTR